MREEASLESKKDFLGDQKQKECDRICGPKYSKESGLHSCAPELCPIQEDLWKNPKRRLQG